MSELKNKIEEIRTLHKAFADKSDKIIDDVLNEDTIFSIIKEIQKKLLEPHQVSDEERKAGVKKTLPVTVVILYQLSEAIRMHCRTLNDNIKEGGGRISGGSMYNGALELIENYINVLEQGLELYEKRGEEG